MIEIAILLAPTIFSSIWAIISLLSKRSGYQCWIFTILMFTLSILLYTETYSIYNHSNENIYSIANIVYKILNIFIPSLIVLYTQRIALHRYYSSLAYLLIMLSILMLFVYIYSSADHIATVDRAYLIATHFSFIAALCNILVALYKRSNSIQLIVTYIRRRELKRHDLILCLLFVLTALIYCRFILQRPYREVGIVCSSIISIVLYIYILKVGYVEVFVKAHILTPHIISHPVDYITSKQNFGHYTQEAKENRYQTKLSELYPQFNSLMESDELFRQQDISIESIAQLMHTNRTYISNLVNVFYSQSFPDYIGSKRVEYAKQLAMENREIDEKEIARLSGFKSVNQMDNRFKERTGVPFWEWRERVKREPPAIEG